jgi:hypothetical protein
VKESEMQTTKQMLVAGLLAAAFLVVPMGFAPPAVHAARPVGGGVSETTAPPDGGGGTIMEAEAGATGQGPANQDECNAHAAKITRLQGELKATMLAGNGEASIDKSDELDAAADFAMDRGCFVVY